jgi:hypothetical protein
MLDFWIIPCLGILSFLGSFTILLIFHLNPLIHQKKINQIVYYIALCDLFGTIGWIIGESRDGTLKCWLQSMITSYFPLVSLFLTTLIAFILFAVIYKKHWTILFSTQLFSCCWFIPLVLTLLPLSTNQYGNPGSTHGWCFLDRSPSHQWTLTFWIFFSFYVWFYVAVLIYFILLWSITYRLSYVYGTLARLQNRCEIQTILRIQRSIRRFIWYPLIILICWFPSALWDINEALDESSLSSTTSGGNGHHTTSFLSRDWDNSYFNIFPASQGLITSIAFLSTNRDIYQLMVGRISSSFQLGVEEVDPGADSNHSTWPFLRRPLVGSSESSTAARGRISFFHRDLSSSSCYQDESESTGGMKNEEGDESDEEMSGGRGEGGDEESNDSTSSLLMHRQMKSTLLSSLKI